MGLFHAIILTIGCTAGIPAQVPTIVDVMTQARSAGGKAASDTGIRLDGTANQNGIDCNYSLRFAQDGRFVESTDGVMGETSGFDLRTGWSEDQSGLAMRLEMEDLETENVSMWVETGRWRAPDGPFDISLSKEGSNDKQIALTLRLKKGLLESRMLLDRTTWLPSMLQYRTSQGDEVWSYSDYRPEQGLMLAHSWTHSAAGNTDSMHVDSSASLARSDWAVFSVPKSGTHDSQFDSAAPPSVPAIHTPDGHIFVHPLINGKDVGWFFLDSGAGAMCITPEAADTAGMSTLGHTSENGVGGTIQSKFRRSNLISLGPVSISNLTFVEIDLKFLAPAFKFKIGGICGYDLFCRTVVKMDVRHGTVEIHSPDRFTDMDAHWRELFLEGKNAAIRCSFEGDRFAVFKLDTGAGDTVTFHAPAVQKYRLLDGRKTEVSMSGGVGGVVGAKVARIDWFEIGGHRFDHPQVTLSLATQGAFTDNYTAGNVGEKFLDPFTVIFDYQHMRIAFEPHDAAPMPKK